jgi:hypothetical protein
MKMGLKRLLMLMNVNRRNCILKRVFSWKMKTPFAERERERFEVKKKEGE